MPRPAIVCNGVTVCLCLCLFVLVSDTAVVSVLTDAKCVETAVKVEEV